MSMVRQPEASIALAECVKRSCGRALPVEPGIWGPAESDALIAGDGGWHDPADEVPAT